MPLEREWQRRMEEGVAAGVFPGAVLCVRCGSDLVHLSAHGRVSSAPDAAAVELDTVFDLASLTKVLATAPLCLMACAADAEFLTREIGKSLPQLGPPLRGITPAQLLTHTAGLTAWRPFFEGLGAAAGQAAGLLAVRRILAEEIPERPAGEREVYSDLGFMLLDWLLEERGGLAFDRLFTRDLAAALTGPDLFFVDLKDAGRAARARAGRRFAATERCPWRGRVLSGEVHDDNAWCMGGVAGHAGLFGTAAAVARVGQEWLLAGQGHSRIWPRDLAARFMTKRSAPGAERSLGFDTPSAQGSQAGTRLGPRTVGHLGFTGTSLWIDPDRQAIVALLTNRVHPSRDNETIRSFRPALHDVVMAGLDGAG